MKLIKILGARGNKSNRFGTTCMQVSKHTVIDAGNIIDGLKDKAFMIDNVFLSHSHLDHVIDVAFLCDNFFSTRKESLRVFGLKETIESVKKHFFNWEVWPDFTTLKLENSSAMALEFIEVQYDKPIEIDGIKLTPIKANHTVPCCGYLIEEKDSGILFSGDTFENDTIWDLLNSNPHVKALIIDVSFPSYMKEIAISSKHLTPDILKKELKKLQRDDVEIYINHIKLGYESRIATEIKDIGLNVENILYGGEVIDYSVPRLTRKMININHLEKIKMLNKIGTALSVKSELNSLLDMIVTEAKNLTDADGGTLYILNTNNRELDFTVIQTNSLGIHAGGSHEKIDWPSVPLFLENGEKNRHMVAAVCALEDRVINIADVYDTENFDFEGTKRFDKSTGYRSKSMLVIPLKNHENNIIGVLQLLNKIESDKIVCFDDDDEEIALSLASQAAVSITNANLIYDLEKLLEGFLKSIIYALKKKSSYTANHIYKMVYLSNMLAKRINKDKSFYKNKTFSKSDFKNINFAALMHDVGKLSTPDYIMDKKTKLDGLYDKIELVKTRVWAIKKELEIEFLKDNITKDEYNKNIKTINQNYELLEKYNTGFENVPDEIIKKIENISKTSIKCAEKDFYIITQDEAKLLMVSKGTLTQEEKMIINDHAMVSIDILNKLPFPSQYSDIPSISGAHHEKINGKGYPLGLKGDEISFEARILALADIFEALTASDRPYKKANKLSVAMQILFNMAKDDDIDRGLVKFFYESGLYMEFAKKFLKRENIDKVTIDFSVL